MKVLKIERNSMEVKCNDFMYSINVEGNIDEFNSYYFCKKGKSIYERVRYQPNVYLKIENCGTNSVKNPRVVINNNRNWSSIESILSEIISDNMSDEEKAYRLFSFISNPHIQCHDSEHRVDDIRPDGNVAPNSKKNTFKERANPVKAINCYYCSSCYSSAANLAILARKAGMEARVIELSSELEPPIHAVTEIYFNGAYHVFDPEMRLFYLCKDNSSIASAEYLHNHPECVLRTHCHGSAADDVWGQYFMKYRKVWPYRELPILDWNNPIKFELRINEMIIFKWGNIGKFRYGNNPKKKQGLPYRLSNGKIIYNLNFSNSNYRKGIVSQTNLQIYLQGNKFGLIPIEAQKWSEIIIRIHSGYPIVGCLLKIKYEKRVDDILEVYVAKEDEEWKRIFFANDIGGIYKKISLDETLQIITSNAIYEFFIMVRIKCNSSINKCVLERLITDTDFQMSETALPAIRSGYNNILYVDDSKERSVSITNCWKVYESQEVCKNVIEPVFPKNGEKILSDSYGHLKWKIPDNMIDMIKNIHIQVSRYKDFRIPVSPNFDRIIYSAKLTWEIPNGWLIKGGDYYWRIKCCNQKGIWSEWSDIMQFLYMPQTAIEEEKHEGAVK